MRLYPLVIGMDTTSPEKLVKVGDLVSMIKGAHSRRIGFYHADEVGIVLDLKKLILGDAPDPSRYYAHIWWFKFDTTSAGEPAALQPITRIRVMSPA